MLILLTITWQLLGLSSSVSCLCPALSRQITSQVNAVNPLMGSKLYDVSACESVDACQSVCLNEDTCLAVTYNAQTQLCSVFTAGTTSYDVAGSQVYVMQSKTIECNSSASCPALGQGQGLCSTSVPVPRPQQCCQCQQGNFGNNVMTCQQLLLSFQASRSTSLTTASSSSLLFDNSMTVDHWSFNKQNGSFTAPVSGLYWLHYSVAIPSGTLAGVRLKGATSFSQAIIRQFNIVTGGLDTTSMGSVYPLSQGDNVYITSAYPLYSDNLLQTSFGGCFLDSVMSPLVAFAFTRLSVFSATTTARAVSFPNILVDTHSGWSGATSEYVVPVTGTYVISVLVQLTSSLFNGMTFAANGVDQLYHVFINVTTQSLTDSVSALTLFSLNATNKICEVLQPTSYTNMIQFSGFLYSPSMMQAVAFSVAVKATNQIYTPTDPVQYDSILVNVGNGWNPNTHTFNAPLDGVYYVHIQIMTFHQSQCEMDILVNGVPTMNVFIKDTTQNNSYQSSRGFMLRLQTGDELRVKTSLGTCYSNYNKHATFSGFLIHR